MDNNSFFSIDRLIEFGLGIGIAQQMVGVMNQSMPTSIAQTYFVAINGQQVGPLNDSELSQLISQKKVTKDTLAWMPGMTGWTPIEQVPAILKLVALTPPPLNV